MFTTIKEMRFITEEALAAYNEVIRINPEHALAHLSKGLMLASLERFGEAMEAFEGAIRINPEDADAHFYKGIVLSEQEGHNEEAAVAFEAALGIDPDHADALNALRDLDSDEEAETASDTSRHSVTRSLSGRSGGLDAQAMVSLAEDFLSEERCLSRENSLEEGESVASGDATPRQGSERNRHSLNPEDAPAPLH